MEKLNRIKGALADAGKTNLWLAEQVGRDPVTVSKWCTNTSQPDLQTLSRIADVLGIDVRELLVSKIKSSISNS
jgi:transcriptional regulator with XRE-family HTH domain